MRRAREEGNGDDDAYFERLEERQRRRNCQIQVRRALGRAWRNPLWSRLFRTPVVVFSDRPTPSDGTTTRDAHTARPLTPPLPVSLVRPQQVVLAGIILSAVFYVLFLVAWEIRGKPHDSASRRHGNGAVT
jgi:hypothetical protein